MNTKSVNCHQRKQKHAHKRKSPHNFHWGIPVNKRQIQTKTDWELWNVLTLLLCVPIERRKEPQCGFSVSLSCCSCHFLWSLWLLRATIVSFSVLPSELLMVMIIRIDVCHINVVSPHGPWWFLLLRSLWQNSLSHNVSASVADVPMFAQVRGLSADVDAVGTCTATGVRCTMWRCLYLSATDDVWLKQMAGPFSQRVQLIFLFLSLVLN